MVCWHKIFKVLLPCGLCHKMVRQWEQRDNEHQRYQKHVLEKEGFRRMLAKPFRGSFSLGNITLMDFIEKKVFVLWVNIRQMTARFGSDHFPSTQNVKNSIHKQGNHITCASDFSWPCSDWTLFSEAYIDICKTMTSFCATRETFFLEISLAQLVKSSFICVSHRQEEQCFPCCKWNRSWC